MESVGSEVEKPLPAGVALNALAVIDEVTDLTEHRPIPTRHFEHRYLSYDPPAPSVSV